ncbi:MAG TPA: thioredoxin domain-containing protein [Gemmatimonadaceae bacterium]
MANRLRESASPYLRQHADNPVDWYEWGPEALERARTTGKPILLSIGYAACHWCHVMAHESFEDEATAALMNELFVNIKVDREERPDLDAIYMQAVQALTGHGGWPMTVFLTPDMLPFHAGTYFPPDDRHGLPSFQRVLRAVSNAWQERRENVEQAGRSLTEHLQRAASPQSTTSVVDRQTLDLAFRALAQSSDAQHGGFGGAPKFPPSMTLDFLLRHAVRTGQSLALDMVVHTFDAMRRGGIHDQIGGGIHRYSVDAQWLVPHFEKMLYDNALFARLGVRLWQVTKDAEVREAAEDTLDWVLREMRDANGGFYSSLDADSEGHEGLFYTWTRAEFVEGAGEDAAVAEAHWGVTEGGNFEGRNILFIPHGVRATAARVGKSPEEVVEALERARQRLYDVRKRRVWPGRDDKVVAAWNALMIRALCEAARAFGRPEFGDAAISAGEFLSSVLVEKGRVSRSALDRRVSGPGVLEDHAAVALAFLDLYSLSFDPSWLQRSREITERTIEFFHDTATDTWYDTAADHERLVVRPREVTDNATPSGTSLVAELLFIWSELDDRTEWRAMAERIVAQVGGAIARYPQALGHLAGVADSLVHGGVQVAFAGDPGDAAHRELVERIATHFVPGLVVAGGTADQTGQPALMHGRAAENGAATAYICRGFTCLLPTSDPDQLEQQVTDLLAHRTPQITQA